MTTTRRRRNANSNAAPVGDAAPEAQLWRMADALRGSMDAAEYKHVVLGLVFLKYISDAFEEAHSRLVAEQAHDADPEDPDEYRAQKFSGCRARRAGPTCRPTRGSPPSGRLLTLP